MKKLTIILMWLLFVLPGETYGQTFEYNDGRTRFDCREMNYLEVHFITSVGARADNEVFDHMNFEIKLPPQMEYYAFSHGCEGFFKFFYKRDESIFIITPLLPSVLPEDTIYEPTIDEVDKVIYHFLLSDYEESPKNRKIVRKLDNLKSMKKDRRNLVIVKNGITILLFNIKKENLQQYQELVSSVKLIDANVSD